MIATQVHCKIYTYVSTSLYSAMFTHTVWQYSSAVFGPRSTTNAFTADRRRSGGHREMWRKNWSYWPAYALLSLCSTWCAINLTRDQETASCGCTRAPRQPTVAEDTRRRPMTAETPNAADNDRSVLKRSRPMTLWRNVYQHCQSVARCLPDF